MMNYLIKRNDGRELDLFDSLFAPIFSSEKTAVMRTDVKKTEKGYLMEVEIPGYDKSEISVEYEKGNLTIFAEKKETEEKEGYVFKERSKKVKRSFYVGEINRDGITAKYENGILTLDIPKEEVELPRKIDII